MWHKILKIRRLTSRKIKFCIFWWCKRKPEMKFSKFRAPKMGRKVIFLLIWVTFVWYEWLFWCWWRMLVKNACWWKTCMLVKNLHQHSPPKFHDVGENNVGEIVCWRKKICSFKIICMLVNYVGENFDVCWWKVFLMTKYVCWWKPSEPNIWSLIKIGWWSIRSLQVNYTII